MAEKPEDMQPPLLIHLYKWIAPSLGFNAWQSLLNDSHFMQITINLQGCVNGPWVAQWAKMALDSREPGPGSDADTHQRAVTAANQLQHSFTQSVDINPIIKETLFIHRDTQVKDSIKWLRLKRQRMQFDGKHHLDSHIEEAIRQYRSWKREKKGQSLQKFAKNLIKTFMDDGMSEEAAREKAWEGSEFVDSSEDETHPTYSMRQQSAPWRAVFGTACSDKNGKPATGTEPDLPHKSATINTEDTALAGCECFIIFSVCIVI